MPAKRHMHIFKYAYNICEKKVSNWLLENSGRSWLIHKLPPHIEAKSENCLMPKCRNFVKNYFLLAKSHMHIFKYAYNICEKKVSNWLLENSGRSWLIHKLPPHIEAKSENCLSPKCRNFVKNYFLLVKSHMHIFNMLITSVKSFKLTAWKLWEELITQTCYPILKPNLKIV